LPVAGNQTGRGHAVVDGDVMGGTDVGEGFDSILSKCSVSKNGRRESGGGDWKMVVLSKCWFSFFFSSDFGIDLIF